MSILTAASAAAAVVLVLAACDESAERTPVGPARAGPRDAARASTSAIRRGHVRSTATSTRAERLPSP